MRSIELTLDEQSDAAFRVQWQSLLDAGLPSQARHTGTSNRPHITLGAGTRFPFADLEDPPESEDPTGQALSGPRSDRLALVSERLGALPVVIRYSGLVVFGAPPRGLVLARLVVPSAELIALHDAVHRRAPGATDLTSPGHWTPHVTLAHRLTPAQLADALPLISPVTAAAAGTAEHARLWDSDTRRITSLTGG